MTVGFRKLHVIEKASLFGVGWNINEVCSSHWEIIRSAIMSFGTSVTLAAGSEKSNDFNKFV